MAYSEAQLDALKNALLASAQPTRITAVKHRQFEDAIIDELFDEQSRGDLFNALSVLLSFDGTEQIFVIKGGVAYLLPASLVSGGGGGVISPIDYVVVNTSGGTITLDMNSQAERMFRGSASIGSTKTWALSNDTTALFIPSVKFVMTTTSIQTFPASFKMSTFEGNWDSGAKQWTPPDTGTYEISATFDGTNWLMKITGPF